MTRHVHRESHDRVVVPNTNQVRSWNVDLGKPNFEVGGGSVS
jgi:hypothetical protein